MLKIAASLAAVFALATSAAASERVTAVFQPDGPMPSTTLIEIDLDVGGVVVGAPFDLGPITPIAIPILRDVARVGAETWVATRDGILRYRESPLTFLDRVLPGRDIQRLHAVPGGAIAQESANELIELDLSGTQTAVRPYSGWLNDFVLDGAGGAAIIDQDLLATDATLTPIGPLSSALEAELTQLAGGFFFPACIDRLPDGRLLIFAGINAVVGSNLSVERVLSFTVGDGIGDGLFGSPSGLVIKIGSLGHGIGDPDTGDIANLFDFNLSPPGRRRITKAYSAGGAVDVGRDCSASANSSGRAARMHLTGSADLGLQSLAAVATGLPAGTVALPILGLRPFDAPFGDGRLCISPFAPGIVRSPLQAATSGGLVRVDYDFMTPGLGGSFAAGSTFHTQVLYRDSVGARFNSTDSAFVTF